MKFIIGNRQSGVTSGLLLNASKFGHVVLVGVPMEKSHAIKLCGKLGIEPPEIFTIYQLKHGELRGRKEVVLDIADFDFVLRTLLMEVGEFNGKVNTLATSVDIFN